MLRVYTVKNLQDCCRANSGGEEGGGSPEIVCAYIEIYIYSKTNQMHNISNLFYFGTTLYMF
jgi:hypothetical protein